MNILKHQPHALLGLILLACTCASVSVPANASNKTLINLIGFMYKNNQLNKEQYDTLMRGIQTDNEQEKNLQLINDASQKKATLQTSNAVKITTKGKLQIESADQDFKFRLGGRIQLDGAVYDDDKTNLGNQTEVRRARLYLSGTLWRSWDFKSQFDFAGERVRSKDLYLRYTGLDPFVITIGHFKEPFSLENLTSSKYITFIERALPDALSSSRNLGFAVQTYGNKWTAALGLFADGINDDEPKGIDESYAVTGRVTVAPILQKRRLLHFGASFSHRELNRGNNSMSLGQKPEAHTADQTLVSTGKITDVSSFNRYGFESALILGSFSVQGQYLFMDIDRESGLDDLVFNGYYVEGSWFLTGENRQYNRKKGAFSHPNIHSIAGMGGLGAWQLAVRFSSLDLNDGSIIGGEESNLSFGLSWYSTPNIRFTTNYTRVLDVYRPGSIHNNDKPNIFQLRAQMHW